MSRPFALSFCPHLFAFFIRLPPFVCHLFSGLCTNLTALRRGDLSAQRLTLEHERLTLKRSRAEQEQEKLFWAWTQRPDIQEKLYPNRDPDALRRDVDRLITEQMLGIRRNSTPENGSVDPACLI